MIQLSQNIRDYILSYFDQEFLDRYLEYHDDEYKPYLRFSRYSDASELIPKLNNYGISLEPVPNLPNAFRILSGTEVAGKTLEFILGKYYIQSLSSMIPPVVLDPGENDTVLDLCAAPGSKTTQLAELMNNRGTLIANEISVERLKSLVFNVEKMSILNAGILHAKGELISERFENKFDKILVDAPCSALGITQKKGEVSNWWDVHKAETIADLQIRLLISAIKMSKVGGEIVYSTCTLTIQENEKVLDTILKKYPVELQEIQLPVKSRAGFTKFGDEILDSSLIKTHRIIPWEINSEGFFVAKLKKIDDLEPKYRGSKKTLNYDFVSSASSKISNYLKMLSEYYGMPAAVFNNYRYLIKTNEIHFVDKSWNSAHLEFFNRIGARLGTVDKRGFLQLNPLAAQIFGELITLNIIELENRTELETYFNGGTIRRILSPGGQKVVKFGNYFLGTAVASKEGIKSQFPRAFRTQQIILPQ